MTGDEAVAVLYDLTGTLIGAGYSGNQIRELLTRALFLHEWPTDPRECFALALYRASWRCTAKTAKTSQEYDEMRGGAYPWLTRSAIRLPEVLAAPSEERETKFYRMAQAACEVGLVNIERKSTRRYQLTADGARVGQHRTRDIHGAPILTLAPLQRGLDMPTPEERAQSSLFGE